MAGDLGRLQELSRIEAAEEKAQAALRGAGGTRALDMDREWLSRRVEGRRQEREARQALNRCRALRKELPTRRELTERIGRGFQALDAGGRQNLKQMVGPAGVQLARKAQRAVERTMGHDRGRGMGR